MYEFPCTGPITANLHVSSGVLRVIAESRDTAQVTVTPSKDNENGRAAAEGVRVEMTGGTLSVHSPTTRGFGFARRGSGLIVEVRVPSESAIEAHAASADMIFEGRLASANIDGASSDVRLEHVSGQLTAHSASGDCQIGYVGGDASIQSASGDVDAAWIGGDVAVRSASGDITLSALGGSAKVHTASGDIKIGSCIRGETRINSASGDIRVGVAEGTAVWLDLNTLSGDSRSELPVSDAAPSDTAPTLTLHVRTVSGDITVARAPRSTAVQDAARTLVQDTVGESPQD